MSSDHTQPVPEWWQQPKVPKKEEQEAQQDQDSLDSQATRQYPTNRGYPAGPTFTPNPEPQSQPGHEPQPGYETQQGYPSQPEYQPPTAGFQSGPSRARARRDSRSRPAVGRGRGPVCLARPGSTDQALGSSADARDHVPHRPGP